MKDAKDAQHYLGEHDALRHELIQMGVMYTDNEAIFNILKGLPCTGTWPAFKLVLQASISASPSTVSAIVPAVSVSSAAASGASTSSAVPSAAAIAPRSLSVVHP